MTIRSFLAAEHLHSLFTCGSTVVIIIRGSSQRIFHETGPLKLFPPSMIASDVAVVASEVKRHISKEHNVRAVAEVNKEVTKQGKKPIATTNIIRQQP